MTTKGFHNQLCHVRLEKRETVTVERGDEPDIKVHIPNRQIRPKNKIHDGPSCQLSYPEELLNINVFIA